MQSLHISSFAFSPLGILSLLQPGYTSVLSPRFSAQICKRPPQKTRRRPYLHGLPSPTPVRDLGSISLLQGCGAEWRGAAQPLPSPTPCSAIIHQPLSFLPALWMDRVLGAGWNNLTSQCTSPTSVRILVFRLLFQCIQSGYCLVYLRVLLNLTDTQQ